MDDAKLNAIILANALVYTSPSADRGQVREKQRMWDRFINALTYDKKKERNYVDEFKKKLAGIVPIKESKK